MKTFDEDKNIKIEKQEQFHKESVAEKEIDSNLKLWNPQAVSWWSIFLSPVFGGILLAINSKKLKNTEMLWYHLLAIIIYIASFSFLVQQIEANYRVFNSYGEINIAALVLVFKLLVWFLWYTFLAKKQIEAVKNLIYQKRKLWIPITIILGIPVLILGIFILWLISIFH